MRQVFWLQIVRDVCLLWNFLRLFIRLDIDYFLCRFLLFWVLRILIFYITLTVGYFLLLIKDWREKEVGVLGKCGIFVHSRKVL
jgi:hypothetical protein